MRATRPVVIAELKELYYQEHTRRSAFNVSAHGKRCRSKQETKPLLPINNQSPRAKSLAILKCSTAAVYPTYLESRFSQEEEAQLDLEARLEQAIYRCRFLAFLGVCGSLIGSILCFMKGCSYVISSFREYFVLGGRGEKVISILIESVDVYLLGTVMLVFGMGLYDLFISNLGVALQPDLPTTHYSHRSNLFGFFKLHERPKWLQLQSVNELKTKVGHVIVMVLLVGVLEKSKKVVITSTLDLFCFSASILISSLGLYLLSKLNEGKA